MRSPVEFAREAVKQRPWLHALLRPLAIGAVHLWRMAEHAGEMALAPFRFGLLWLDPRAPGIGKGASGDLVVMLVVSNLRSDPRVRRAAQTLSARGHGVHIICPAMPGDDRAPLGWGEEIRVEWLDPGAARFAYRFPCFLGGAMLRAARMHRPFAFHAHDLTTTLIALTCGHASGAHVICDFHEWMSQSVAPDGAGGYRPLSPHAATIRRWLERLAIRRASAAITVSQGIAEAMDREAGTDGKVTVIRNLPSDLVSASRAYPDLRESLNVKPEQQLILYSGEVGPSRQIEPVIRALAGAPRAVLAIRGPGLAHYAGHYRRIALEAGAAERLHLLDPVPSSDVIAAAKGADAGLYTVADLCLSFTHALPNKVFEYLYAGLPLLCADFPEVRRLVDESGTGLTFDPANPADIARAMRMLDEAPERIAAMRANIPAFVANLRANPEWDKLATLYARLGVRKAGAS